MQILDYSNKKLLLISDIHGEFNKIFYALKTKTNKKQLPFLNIAEESDYTDTCIVVCGDCGFGFNKLGYYNSALSKLNDLLVKSNNVLLFIRGNHDNPDYFNCETEIFNFSNIKLIRDYTILKTETDVSLCIGGAISMDRSWRKYENLRKTRFHHTSECLVYWDNEGVQLNDSIIEDLVNCDIEINSIISHTAPIDFIHVVKDEIINSPWMQQDTSLLHDMKNEWQSLHTIYEILSKKNLIEWWVCGHYHTTFHGFIPSTKTMLISLDIFNYLPKRTSDTNRWYNGSFCYCPKNINWNRKNDIFID